MHALLALLLLADVPVNPQDHVRNREPGLCAWCALETLGRTHGYAVQNLTQSKKTPGSHQDLVQELQRRKIPFHHSQANTKEKNYLAWHYQDRHLELLGLFPSQQEAQTCLNQDKRLGSFWCEQRLYWNYQPLREALRKKLGAAVTLQTPTTLHMLVLVGMDDKEARLIDSNSPGKIRKMPLYEFLQNWEGFALVIEKPLAPP